MQSKEVKSLEMFFFFFFFFFYSNDKNGITCNCLDYLLQVLIKDKHKFDRGIIRGTNAWFKFEAVDENFNNSWYSFILLNTIPIKLSLNLTPRPNSLTYILALTP